MKRFVMPLGVAVILITASACEHSAETDQKTAARPLPVKTTEAHIAIIHPELDITARVQSDPARVVRVYPPAGGRLIRVTVRPGEAVKHGQAVAILESSDVAAARSDLAKAEAEYDRATHTLSRSKLLFDHKVLSEREYEDAVAQQTEAKSELERARSRLLLLGASEKGASNQVSVTSPIAGTVIDIGAASGELSKSTDNANPICTVADLSSVWLLGDVYEKDLPDVHPGVPIEATIPAFPGRMWRGKVARISDVIDPATRTA